MFSKVPIINLKVSSMKKARIMLTFVAVFAVLGGTFALKAPKFSGLWVYQRVSPTSCPLVGGFDSTTAPGITVAFPNATFGAGAATTNPALCTTIVRVKSE